MLDKRNTSLNLLYNPFREKLVKGLNNAKKDGFPVHIFETYRSFDRQGELYAQGRTTPGNKVTWAKPGRSFHNYGIAADICMKDKRGRWTWEDEGLYQRLGPYLIDEGLKWLSPNELVHFQLDIDSSISELNTLYKNFGLLGVWSFLDKKIGVI